MTEHDHGTTFKNTQLSEKKGPIPELASIGVGNPGGCLNAEISNAQSWRNLVNTNKLNLTSTKRTILIPTILWRFP